MGKENKNRVCPVERSGTLDNRIRRWLQNPRKIIGPYIKEGMTVLDFGCGPGFFSIEIARMVGDAGKVIASDLQDGMLSKVGDKIKGTELEDRITLHPCGEDTIGLSEQVDFVLLFYVAHEVPDQERLFREIATLLKPGGQVLMAEPSFHVSKARFRETVARAMDAGLTGAEGPKLFLSKTVILKKI